MPPRQDFIREMQQKVQEQRSNAARERDKELHDDRIITDRGMKNWDELFFEVKKLAEEIGFTFWPLDGHGFKIKNLTNELEVTLESGGVRYAGTASGRFIYSVLGQDLRYSHQQRTNANKEMSVSVTNIGQTLTVEEVAEKLVRMVIGNS